MSLITGVGDEVTEVVVLLILLGVAVLAWMSTGARPDRFRTVLVMGNTNTQRHPLTINIRRHTRRHRHLLSISRVATLTAGTTPNSIDNPAEPVESAQNGTESAIVTEGEESLPGSEQVQEMDSIVDAMDADIMAVRNRRQSLRRTNDETTSNAMPDMSTPTSHARSGLNLPRNIHKIINSHTKYDGEDTENTQESKDQPVNTDSSETESKEENSVAVENVVHNINIKLKYLNETFKEVDGSLEELLKDFKWRHFSAELSANYRVLLIFNGHVLSEDASTLSACGLYHNCVVHCLVHPPRNANQRGGTEMPPSLLGAGAEPVSGAQAPSSRPMQAEPRIWDLENVLMTLVSIVLTIVWFFRCEYSNMFTASASVALFGLTLFYSVAIFGLYLSDTFQFNDNGRQQAAPTHPVPQN